MSGFVSTISALGNAAFQLAYELSPISFSGGIAQGIEGGVLPIIAITEATNFVLGLLSGPQNLTLDNFFAHFQPLPGSTLLDLQISSYPFANQAVAANATISQPLTLSYLMRCPSRNIAGYWAKGSILTGLQQAITQHARLGGTYICATPAAYYPNGILTALRDVSDAQSKQPQNAYQWDFTFPLLTQQQAQATQNSLMSKITGGTQISGPPSWSGGSATVGASSSLVTPSVIPASSGVPPIANFSGI